MAGPVITLADVEAALHLPQFDVESAWRRMLMRPHVRPLKPPPGKPERHAGVLALLYPVSGALYTVLMRRTDHPGVHAGQVSFPGGAWEPGDASYTATALREACEEMGVCGREVRVLGQLTRLYIPPSGFTVWPVVACVPKRPAFRPSPDEVAAVLEMPLAHLLDDNARCETPMTLGGITMQVPYYDVQGHVVWGATALILSEFEARLRAVLGA